MKYKFSIPTYFHRKQTQGILHGHYLSPSIVMRRGNTKLWLRVVAGVSVVAVTLLSWMIVKVGHTIQVPSHLRLCLHLWPRLIWADQLTGRAIYNQPAKIQSKLSLKIVFPKILRKDTPLACPKGLVKKTSLYSILGSVLLKFFPSQFKFDRNFVSLLPWL